MGDQGRKATHRTPVRMTRGSFLRFGGAGIAGAAMLGVGGFGRGGGLQGDGLRDALDPRAVE